MTTPYQKQPSTAFWRRSISDVAPGDVDPVVGWSLKIDQDTKVATAGSCFAQHIARRLARSGYHYFVTEPAHPEFSRELKPDYAYEAFTARYGNIYTSRQLIQLMQRAYGTFEPAVDRWRRDDAWVDPFRPNIQPGGFPTVQEFEISRRQHFAAVRRMFEELDVFVFTLGLTEGWQDTTDGAVYPLCPGVAGGEYLADRHALLNLTVEEVVKDMSDFMTRLSEVNPGANVILTVSPVPLIATAEARHVLVATTYSKSVLRVAADIIASRYTNAHYFPSYEIITGAFNRGEYYAEDLRDVREVGVDHVMRTFFRHATDGAAPHVAPRGKERTRPSIGKRLRQVVSVICDENSLDVRGA